MNSTNIPQWLTEEEKYNPAKDTDRFIDKTATCILEVLSKIKIQNTYNSKYPELASLKLIFNILLIILTSCSKNFYFVSLIIAAILIRLCLLKGDKILIIFKLQLYVLLLSSLVLLPSAILMNNLSSSIFILTKIYVSTTLMIIFSLDTQWNSLSSSLSKFKIPDTFIFIFDITLKYIILLGNLSLDMLTALKLRSVGVNNHKQKSISYILGTTFIKSVEMSEEMLNAMVCRGFTGQYKIHSKKIYKPILIKYLILSLIVILIFIYLR